MVDRPVDVDPDETREWLDALDSVLEHEGPERAHFLIEQLIDKARRSGVHLPYRATTAYVNTIPRPTRRRRPGEPGLEHRIRSIIRWNALAMVVQANREQRRARRPHRELRLRRDALRRRLQPLLPRRRRDDFGGDLVYIQGHCVARHLRARVPRGPARRGAAAPLPPGGRRRAGSPRIRIRG